MIQYDSNLQEELAVLIDLYEKLRAEDPTMERKHTIMLLCAKILNGGFDYIKLPEEYKKMYDFFKSKHPNWNHKQLMACISVQMVFDDTNYINDKTTVTI